MDSTTILILIGSQQHAKFRYFNRPLFDPNDLGEPGEVSPGIPEPLDVPRAEEQVGGLAGLNLDGLGIGGGGPEQEGEREGK